MSFSLSPAHSLSVAYEMAAVRAMEQRTRREGGKNRARSDSFFFFTWPL